MDKKWLDYKWPPRYERDVHGAVWTRHGFAIPGKDAESVERPSVMRCGGLKWCDECQADVETASH